MQLYDNFENKNMFSTILDIFRAIEFISLKGVKGTVPHLDKALKTSKFFFVEF